MTEIPENKKGRQQNEIPTQKVKKTVLDALDKKANEISKRYNFETKGNGAINMSPAVFKEIKDDIAKVTYLHVAYKVLVNRKEIFNAMWKLFKKNDKQAILYFADFLKNQPEVGKWKVKPDMRLPDQNKSFKDLLDKIDEKEEN